jgi:UDP-3-O-[3-hydroxymyristoyl] glucosamine N-acyltransferase
MSRFRPSRNYVSGKVVFEGGPVDITGDLIVSGSVIANEYSVNVVNTNVVNIDSKGNTKFGDSADDVHQFTGSVFIQGTLSASNIIGGSGSGGGTPGGPNNSVQFNDGGAFGGDPSFIWTQGSDTLTVIGTVVITGSTSELQTPEIQFDVDHTVVGHDTGRLYWDDNVKTVSIDMQGSDVRLQLGQEQHVYAKNTSGVVINNGDAVRIKGAAGTNIEIEKAISEIRPFTLPTEQDAILGVATEQIPDNQSGYVTTFGQVRDVNTFGFSEGDILYLSNTTSGSYDNIKPPAPYFPARVGIVEVVNATTGIILVRPSEPTFFTDIAGVTSSNVPVGVPSYLCYDENTEIVSFTNELSGAFSGSFQGDGSLIDDLNASNITTGTLNNSRLPSTISVTNITASNVVSASLFYGDGSNLTNLSAAGSNTQIQYNADGNFGADADLTWSSGSNSLLVNGYVSSSAIYVSSSEDAETLMRVDSFDTPYLFTIDASSSFDGAPRIMMRNSNDDIVDPNGTIGRGLLHLEQESTSSGAGEANGISIWTYAQEQYQSRLNLTTWDPPPGVGSEIQFFTQEGTFPIGGVVDNQVLGRLSFGGWDGNGTYSGGFIIARATEFWNFSVKNGTDFEFYMVPKNKGTSANLKERIRMTGEGHLIIFPYSASNNDTIFMDNSFDKSAGAPALQVYGPTLFGSSSINSHVFTGSIKHLGPNIHTGDYTQTGNKLQTGYYELTGAFYHLGDTFQTGDYELTGTFNHLGSSSQAGDYVQVGDYTLTGAINHTGSTSKIGDTNQTGDYVQVGDYTLTGAFDHLGDTSQVGDTLQVGDYTLTGAFNHLGTSSQTGDYFFTGNFNHLGDSSQTGDYSQVGDYTLTGAIYQLGEINLTGPLTQSGSYTLTGAFNHLGTSSHVGDYTLTGAFDHLGDTTQAGDYGQEGNYTLTGAFNHLGASSHVGDYNQTGDYSLTGNFDHLGASSQNGDHVQTGDYTLTGAFNHLGDTTHTGDYGQVGDYTLTGAIYQLGEINLTGPMFQTGDYTLTGAFNHLGTSSHVGDYGQTGDYVQVGDYTLTGAFNHLGTSSHVGDYVQVGDYELTGAFNHLGDTSHTGDTLQVGDIEQTGSYVITGSLTVRGPLELEGGLQFGSSFASATLTGNTDNLVIANLETSILVRLEASPSNYSLTGIVVPDNTKTFFFSVFNVGTRSITFKDEDAGSDADNRFLLGANVVVQAGEGITLIYDPVDTRWRSPGKNI